jgi:nitrite reductase (NADH) large subunit
MPKFLTKELPHENNVSQTYEANMNKHKIVVVGNGMVGHHFVDQMLASEFGAEITVIGSEPRPAYDRVHLSEVFSGKEPKDLALTSREFYKDNNVIAHFGDAVTDIQRDKKQVVTESGRVFS